MRAFIVACALTTAALAQPAPPLEASHDIQVLVKEALEDRLAANNIPDLNLFDSARRIAIPTDMRRSHANLNDDALPHLDGYEFYLTSSTELQAEADRTGRDIFFLTVDDPSINRDTATLWVGTDVVFPRTPRRIKQCCGMSNGQFHKDGRWTFVKWLAIVVS